MTILLWGPDDYRRRAKEKQITADFSTKHSALGFGKFDLSEDGTGEKLADFLISQSIFEPYKLVLVSGISENKDKALAGLLKNSQKQPGVLVVVSEKEAPESPWTFLRAKAGKNKEAMEQKFKKLSGPDWKKFVRVEASGRGLKLPPDSEELLLEAFKGDSWGIVTELEKISLSGNNNPSVSDLEKLGVAASPDFFPVLMTLKSQNLSARLRALEQLFLENEPAAKIFNIVSAQWPGKEEKMALYDQAVKSGKCDYEEVLADIVLGG